MLHPQILSLKAVPFKGGRSVIRDFQPGRMPSGHDRCARWRAIRAARIGLREAHALGGELVEIWQLVEGAAVAREIGPTEVVGEDDDNVWFVCGFWFGGLQRRQRREQEGDEEERVRHER